MADPSFRLLSPAEFERLTHAQQLAYLSDAMKEQGRDKARRQVIAWDKLFRQVQQQPD